MSQLAVYLFGPPRIEREGAAVDIARRKALALLAYLAVTAQSHSRDALATLLWPEHDQERARANLRVALATLNKAIGDGWLQVDRDNVLLGTHAALSPESGLWLDVRAFRDRVAACRAHCESAQDTCPACLSSLAKAVDLYRDDFLAGFTLRDSPAFDEWQFFESEGLRSDLSFALEKLARAYERAGAYETAIPHARRWMAMDALHEPAHRLLMVLYARSGQRAAALRQYGECQRVVEEELGAEPEAATAQLYERIRRGEVDGQSPVGHHEAAHPLSSSLPQPQVTRSHNLPAQATGFVGRETQLTEVRSLLLRPEVRLVTLTGPGGVGKTRLSLQVAVECADAFQGGVGFVPLAAVDEPALVAPAIAVALGMQRSERGAPASSPQADVVERLKEYLENREMLLLLDNLEQVLSAAPLVGELLAAASGLKMLATSRVPLQAYGEHVYLVPPLVTPEPQADPSPDAMARLEAVQLFVQRARAARSGFEITDENAVHIAGICTRLDGLPLAIELAAARVRMLPPATVLERLDHALGFLVGGAVDLPHRQRTLRATVDWSHHLLEPGEKVLFRRLAVFAGGCSLEAVEAVSDTPDDADLLDQLQGLVDKNMLQASQVGGELRFSMLETIREYAWERLEASAPAERDRVRRRHSRHFMALAEQAELKLHSADMVGWEDRLAQEYDNLRAALAWSLDNDLETGLRLACALNQFWNNRIHRRDGDAWLRRLLDKADECAADLAPLRAKAMNMLGRLAWGTGRDWGNATLWLQRSVELWQQVGDPRGLGYALMDMARIPYVQRDLVQACSLATRAVDMFRQIDDETGLALALALHGLVTWRAGDFEKASSSTKEAVHICDGADLPYILANATSILGRIALSQGQLAAARTYLERSVASLNELGDLWRSWVAQGWLGNMLYRQGEFERAAAIWEEALAISVDSEDRPGSPWMLYSVGFASLRRGNGQRARDLFRQSLTLLLETGTRQEEIAACLVGLAGVAVRAGQPKRGARLLSAVDGYLQSNGKDLYPVNQIDHEWIVEEARSSLDEAAWETAWQEGQAMTPDQTFDYALAEADAGSV